MHVLGPGHTGPRHREAGYDPVLQAEVGLMEVTGAPDGDPMRVGVAMTDFMAAHFMFAGILLALRDPLHSWVRNLTWPELRSALMLLAMTFLLLPILPDRPIDPWEVINPAEIWLLAIFIAAISFAGYIAVRIFGDRAGIAVAAVAGGLASSTATTISFARSCAAASSTAATTSSCPTCR